MHGKGRQNGSSNSKRSGSDTRDSLEAEENEITRRIGPTERTNEMGDSKRSINADDNIESEECWITSTTPEELVNVNQVNRLLSSNRDKSISSRLSLSADYNIAEISNSKIYPNRLFTLLPPSRSFPNLPHSAHPPHLSSNILHLQSFDAAAIHQTGDTSQANHSMPHDRRHCESFSPQNIHFGPSEMYSNNKHSNSSNNNSYNNNKSNSNNNNNSGNSSNLNINSSSCEDMLQLLGDTIFQPPPPSNLMQAMQGFLTAAYRRRFESSGINAPPPWLGLSLKEYRQSHNYPIVPELGENISPTSCSSSGAGRGGYHTRTVIVPPSVTYSTLRPNRNVIEPGCHFLPTGGSPENWVFDKHGVDTYEPRMPVKDKSGSSENSCIAAVAKKPVNWLIDNLPRIESAADGSVKLDSPPVANSSRPGEATSSSRLVDQLPVYGVAAQPLLRYHDSRSYSGDSRNRQHFHSRRSLPFYFNGISRGDLCGCGCGAAPLGESPSPSSSVASSPSPSLSMSSFCASYSRGFSCRQCAKSYASGGALKMHARTHTLPCKCAICGKAFSRPWLLQGHLRTHTGEKPFACDQCGRPFADRSNLRAHAQTHAQIKKYGCSNCAKTFSRMSLLLKHRLNSCSKRA